MLAHGGTAGAALEVAFLLLPVALFALFSWRSSRRQSSEATPDERSHGAEGDVEPDDHKEAE